MSAGFTPDLGARVISSSALLNLAAQAPPSKAKDAAQQFEALLIATLLRTARESFSGSWDGDEEESSQSSTMLDLAGQQFSQMMARQGGFGLARLIGEGLDRTPAPQAQTTPLDNLNGRAPQTEQSP